MIDYAVIGKRIQLSRQNKGITQEKLAERAGISVVYLSKIENGRVYPTLETLSNLCTELIQNFQPFYPTQKLPARIMQTTGYWSCSTPVPSGSNPLHFPCWKNCQSYN